jgi:hypothetical protein
MSPSRPLSRFCRCSLYAAIAVALGAPCVSFGAKPKAGIDAYVIVGHLDQAWYRQVLAAIGKVGGNNADVYEAAEPLIKKKIADLEKLGYKVKRVDSASWNVFRKCLTDPNTRAVVWFGHGEKASPGSVTGFYGGDPMRSPNQRTDVISPADLKEWAREKWARKNGWDGQDTPDNWLTDKYGHDEELLAAKRREINAANHGLEYGYFHTCYAFDNMDLATIMMKRDPAAKAFGFKGVKVWFNEEKAQQAAFLKGKVVIGDPKEIEPRRQILEAIKIKNDQATAADGKGPDPDLEEISVKPAKSTGKPGISPKKTKEDEANDPDLEEVKVEPRRSRRSGQARDNEGGGATGQGKTANEKVKEETGRSSDVRPNLVRTSWSGEITVQEEGAPPQVTPFSFSIDSSNNIKATFRLGIFAEDEAQGIRLVQAEGRYDGKTGRVEMNFDKTFTKTDVQLTKVPDYVMDNGKLVQIGEHDERFTMVLSYHAWGMFSGEADSGQEMRGNFELKEQSTRTSPDMPDIAARYSDKSPSETSGTWRARKTQ